MLSLHSVYITADGMNTAITSGLKADCSVQRQKNARCEGYLRVRLLKQTCLELPCR